MILNFCFSPNIFLISRTKYQLLRADTVWWTLVLLAKIFWFSSQAQDRTVVSCHLNKVKSTCGQWTMLEKSGACHVWGERWLSSSGLASGLLPGGGHSIRPSPWGTARSPLQTWWTCSISKKWMCISAAAKPAYPELFWYWYIDVECYHSK